MILAVSSGWSKYSLNNESDPIQISPTSPSFNGFPVSISKAFTTFPYSGIPIDAGLHAYFGETMAAPTTSLLPYPLETGTLNLCCHSINSSTGTLSPPDIKISTSSKHLTILSNSALSSGFPDFSNSTILL